MKDQPGIWIRRLKAKAAIFLGRDLFVFTFFLLLSFIFWFLNSLRKDIETDLRYPVRFINPPKGMELAEKADLKLAFNLKGPGYSIVKLKVSGNRAPLVVDLSRKIYKKLPGGKPSDYYIVSGSLIQDFSRQMRSEFQINYIRPDTIIVSLIRKSSQSQNIGR